MNTNTSIAEINWLNPDARGQLEEWYIMYHKMLCKHLEYKNRKHQSVLSREEISDIAIKTLDILYKNSIDKKFVYETDSKLKGYLKTIATNTLSNYKKNNKLTIVDFDLYNDYHNGAGGKYPDHLEQQENENFKDKVIQCLNECIQHLSKEDQTLVNLFYFKEEKSRVKTIGTIMGKKESWVKGRLFQIRNKIKNHLAKNGFDEEWKIFDSFQA